MKIEIELPEHISSVISTLSAASGNTIESILIDCISSNINHISINILQSLKIEDVCTFVEQNIYNAVDNIHDKMLGEEFEDLDENDLDENEMFPIGNIDILDKIPMNKIKERLNNKKSESGPEDDNDNGKGEE